MTAIDSEKKRDECVKDTMAMISNAYVDLSDVDSITIAKFIGDAYDAGAASVDVQAVRIKAIEECQTIYQQAILNKSPEMILLADLGVLAKTEELKKGGA